MLYNTLSCHHEFEGRTGTVRNLKITEALSGYTFFSNHDLVFCFLDLIFSCCSNLIVRYLDLIYFLTVNYIILCNDLIEKNIFPSLKYLTACKTEMSNKPHMSCDG